MHGTLIQIVGRQTISLINHLAGSQYLLTRSSAEAKQLRGISHSGSVCHFQYRTRQLDLVETKKVCFELTHQKSCVLKQCARSHITKLGRGKALLMNEQCSLISLSEDAFILQLMDFENPDPPFRSKELT